VPEPLFNAEAQRYVDSLASARAENDLHLIYDFEKQIRVHHENLFVLIPCYIEETGLFASLEAYVESGIPRSCMFVVFINASKANVGEKRFAELLEARLKEVDAARQDFGETKLIAVHHHFESKPTLSRLRGLVTDAVVKGCLVRRTANPIVVSNDADAIWYAPDYLENIRKAFDETPEADYMSGPISWSGMDEDGFVRYEPFMPLPEVYLSDLLSQIADDVYREQSPVYTTGCNSAYRLSTLCTVGGYDYTFAPYFDVEIGRVLNRHKEAQGGSAMSSGIFLPDCFLITSPRRAIHAQLENIPYGHQFETFGTVLGSSIELDTGVELYRKSKLFMQIEDLMNLEENREKVESRLTSVFKQWLEGEPTPYKRTLASKIAPSAGIALDTTGGAEQTSDSIQVDWKNSPLVSVLESWADRYRDALEV